MSKATTRTYLLFKSTSHVMRAETLLVKAGVAARLVPVPRTLSSECGVCLRLQNAAARKARTAIEEGGVVVVGQHRV